MPNPFCQEEGQDFLTTIHQPVFQTPAHGNLELPAEAGKSATESSVTEEGYAHFQHQLIDTLRTMTDHLAMLSVPLAPPAPSEPKTHVKPRSPDPFNGSNLGKLYTFLFQCSIYIVLCGQDFPDETHQVAFMLSHLKGSMSIDSKMRSPWTHGQSSLMSTAWLSSTLVFISELHRIFGPRDPVNDTTVHIKNLRYRDVGKAIKYTLDFNRGRAMHWLEQQSTLLAVL